MRRDANVFVWLTVLGLLSISNLVAETKQQQAVGKEKQSGEWIELTDQIDSVCYAIGRESAILSINSYLYSMEVLNDTRNVSQAMADSISNANYVNRELYLAGVYDALCNHTKKEHGDVYAMGTITGKYLGEKVESFKESLRIDRLTESHFETIISGIRDVLTGQPSRLHEDAGSYIDMKVN